MDMKQKVVENDSTESIIDTADNRDETTEAGAVAPAMSDVKSAPVNAIGKTLPADYSIYSPLAKLAIQNTLMIMAGKYGGGFFVKFIQDEGTSYGWLCFTIVYPDGSYKTIQLFKNYFGETDTESSNGVWKPSSKDTNKGAKGYARIDWDGPPNAENYAPLDAYTTPRMPIPAKEIWKKILEHYNAIPIVKISQTANIEQLITEIELWAEENAKEYGQGFVNSEKECYITAEAFRDIVEQHGWNFGRARTELDLLGLFVKDNSTRGYQKAKRVGGTVKRFYAIRKDIAKAVNPPKLLEDIEYNCNYKTEEERRIARLEHERNKYVEKYNGLATKTGNDIIFI